MVEALLRRGLGRRPRGSLPRARDQQEHASTSGRAGGWAKKRANGDKARASPRTPALEDNHINVMSDSDLPKLVSFFRQASPYIGQHFGKTFVLLVPGYIIDAESERLDRVLQDVALLQNLGVRLCLVLGATASIDKVLRQMGETEEGTKFVDGYRITSAVALQAVRQAAGSMRIEIESRLSKFFPAGSARRHGYNQQRANLHHLGSSPHSMANQGPPGQPSNGALKPPVQVVSGNFVMARHKGVVNGVNFEFTGEVRNIWSDAIQQHIDRGQVVVVDNLGYTERGQVLNCSSFEVARRVSQALEADKLIVYHGEQIAKLNLPAWIGLSDDNSYIWSQGESFESGESYEEAGLDGLSTLDTTKLVNQLSKSGEIVNNNVAELSLAIQVCREGVPRTHLINAYTDGSLFLELYTRDGYGTMVSKDLYEGMRPADSGDLDPLKRLLRPMVMAGTLIERTDAEIEQDIANFTVIEREGRVIGCALLRDIGGGVGEISAFVVHEDFRTEHRGDALLDYVEQRARHLGLTTVVLLTTRTGDWFSARGFETKGAAHMAHAVLPKERIAAIDPKRESMLFVKNLDPSGAIGPPGSRIGY